MLTSETKLSVVGKEKGGMLLACEPSYCAAYMNAEGRLHVDSVGKIIVADSARGLPSSGGDDGEGVLGPMSQAD